MRELKQLDQKTQVSTDAAGSTKQTKSQIELPSSVMAVEKDQYMTVDDRA